MLWKGLSVASASSSPIVVVLSGSMEPAFQRGDLLFLWNRSPRTEVGEIVVYNVRRLFILCMKFVCLADIQIKGARQGHPHRPPRRPNLPRGRGKGQEGQGDHSVCCWPFDIYNRQCTNSELQRLDSFSYAPDQGMFIHIKRVLGLVGANLVYLALIG